MPILFKELSSQISNMIKHLSAGRLIALLALVGGSIAGFLYLIMWSGTPDFIPLYSNLSADDTGQVISTLKEQKIPYRLSAGGTVVQVPQQHLYEVRLNLASRGLPRGSGIGFEVFDNTKLGVTEFVQNVNYQRALQGELSRTINGLAEVESTRVHIVMSKKSLFIEDEEPASASIILKLRNGRYLSKDQVQGIVHLVSSSVPRLKPDKVTVIDSDGDMLAGFQDKDSFSRTTSDQIEFQDKKERAFESRVKTMLESVLGENKAIVRVSCELDFVQQEKTEEMYFPDNQVVRSEQNFSEMTNNKDATPQGIPGLATNLGGDGAADIDPDQSALYRKQDNTRNYEIGKMVNHQVIPMGKMRRLSVAVVVDGTYKTTIVGEGAEAKEEISYVPRSTEEMAKLENLVKRAVNVDEARGDKVEVVNIPFETELDTDQVASTDNILSKVLDYAVYLKYAAAGFFIFFTFIFIIRPLIRWLTSVSLEEIELIEHLPKTIAELESEYANKPKQGELQYAEEAAKLLTSNDENSERLMQQWLQEQQA
ncbi:MAG: flagellar M-ring protein FliF [Desulfobacteraceae bacterium]|nr:flagellar M-ring protein FliF [Desulfobacteraceae bacterium]